MFLDSLCSRTSSKRVLIFPRLIDLDQMEEKRLIIELGKGGIDVQPM